MTVETDGRDWYLVQVKPNRDRIAERNLLRQGFDVFRPWQETTRRRRGSFSDTRRPLFPGYLFAGLAPRQSRWSAIDATYGVARLVRFGGAPPRPLPGELVAGLAARCDGEGRLLREDALVPGDRVRVVAGPFADMVSTVDGLAPDRRVLLLLEILGGPTRVALSAAGLRRSGEAP